MRTMPSDPSDLSIALAALYLAGGPRPFEPSRRLWPGVEHVLRSSHGGPESLAKAGFRQEALLLACDDLWDWAAHQVRMGACIAATDARYPARWLKVLGHAATPVLWIAGEMPPAPFMSVVGSRKVGRNDYRFARAVGRAAVALGFSPASGGAAGCDSASVAGVGARAVEILPRGICPADARAGRCRLSARPPDEAFTSAAAMERNALIYAISDHTVVVHARLNEGGTWAGARTALRRKLCTVLVHGCRDDPAARALISLGGIPLERPEDLASAMAAQGRQLELADGEP